MKSVLVVDDDVEIRELIGEMLSIEGFTVRTADNGRTALTEYREHRPDLIVLDTLMPEKDGIETVREIRRIDPAVRVIAISGGGFAGPKSYLSAMQAFGANRTFVKPLDLPAFVAAALELSAS